MMLGFSGRPWYQLHGSNGGSYSDLANHQNTWETNTARATPNSAILTDYSGGKRGAALHPGRVQTEARRFLGDLNKVYPNASQCASKSRQGQYLVHLENWSLNPLTKGSYTCNGPGYFTTIAENEGRPVGNLFFAGEHTSSFYDWQGFMEGAALSGVRAAEEAFAHLRGKRSQADGSGIAAGPVRPPACDTALRYNNEAAIRLGLAAAGLFLFWIPGSRNIVAMNLERITVEFHAEEDRLLLRVFFDKTSEIQFWLTRRLVKRIWPVLLQMAQARPEIQLQPSPEARKALLGFQHEKALQEVKFSKATQEPGREHPLGSAPMLVSKVRTRRNQKGQTVLSLMPQEGNGVDLALGDTLLHGVLKLMQDTASKAEWDLSLAVPALAPAAEEETNRTVN